MNVLPTAVENAILIYGCFAIATLIFGWILNKIADL